MKFKQHTLKALEFYIDDCAQFMLDFEKNFPLFKEQLLLLDGVLNTELTEFLDNKGCAYIIKNACNLNIKATKEVVFEEEKVEKEPLLPMVVEKELFDKPIRSGTDISLEGSASFLKRINNGATIKAKGSLEFFDIIDGKVECDGEYILLKNIKQGLVIFKGEVLEASHFDDTLKLVTYTNRGLEIKEL